MIFATKDFSTVAKDIAALNNTSPTEISNNIFCLSKARYTLRSRNSILLMLIQSTCTLYIIICHYTYRDIDTYRDIGAFSSTFPSLYHPTQRDHNNFVTVKL